MRATSTSGFAMRISFASLVALEPRTFLGQSHKDEQIEMFESLDYARLAGLLR